MARKLATGVLVRDPETAQVVWFGPDSPDVPEWVAEQASGDHLWTGDDDVDDSARPAGNASLADWQAYAAAQGVDVEGLSRDDIRAKFDN